MTAEITNSLDWYNVELALKSEISSIKNPRTAGDARKMLQNINQAITKLSQLELVQRRTQGSSGNNVKEQLIEVNDQISQFEQWVLIAVLSA
jgi:hypothetical protein